jgi:peptide deformylase
MSTFRDERDLRRLRRVAHALRNTAIREGAVGLAAQQCGLDISLIYIDGTSMGAYDDDDDDGSPSSRRTTSRRARRGGVRNGIFLANPRIVDRSSESDMLVWTEECLVLPPEFRATLLRDAEVIIEYESIIYDDLDDAPAGTTRRISLRGELARCAQHEIDHDMGILIVDHVSLDELLVGTNGATAMADIENWDGMHDVRMMRAYSRDVVVSSLDATNDAGCLARRATRYNDRPHFFVPSANAMDRVERPSASAAHYPLRPTEDRRNPSQAGTYAPCDGDCQEERKRVVERRRAIMEQSRSSTSRADVLELSSQRSALYGTEFRGLSPRFYSRFRP